MLIRLHGCAGWSASLLFAYDIRHVFTWPGPYNRRNSIKKLNKRHFGLWVKGQRSLTWVQCAKVKSHFKKTYEWAMETRARNRTPPSFYACPGYQQRWYDSIKNKWASMETPFSHYKSMGNFLDSRAANSVVGGPIWPKFELVQDFMHVLVTCKYEKDWIKNNWEMVETSFSPLYINGGFLLPLKPVLIQSAPKPYAAFTRTPPPPQWYATHKIWSTLANWPQRYSSSKV